MRLFDLAKEVVKKHPELSKPILEKSVEEMYEKAYTFYQDGAYTKAISLFQCLVFQRPVEPIYWEGLASSCFAKKEFKLSLNAWAMVAMLDPKNGKAHLYAAECYFSLGQADEGLKALEKAKKQLNTQKTYLYRIELLEKAWGENNG